MKIELKKKIGFFDVDTNTTIRPSVLMMLLQEAATDHSEKVGMGFSPLMAQGKAWVLYQMGVHIHRAPGVDDEILIQTWHAGEEGFMAYRDYQVSCGGETLVTARGVWILIDVDGRKLNHFAGEINAQYTREPQVFDAEAFNAWKPWLRPELTHIYPISLRPADFDSLGHVNNAKYFEYLEVLIHRALGEQVMLKNMHIQYSKEIPAGTREIEVGLELRGDRYVFKLFSGRVMHAIGDFQPA